MRATYVKQYFGTIEAVETAIKMFDYIFRLRYNVYGGHRDESHKTADGEYEVTMSYTADWFSTPQLLYLFPEFTAQGLEQTFYRWTSWMQDTDDWYFYTTPIKEVTDIGETN